MKQSELYCCFSVPLLWPPFCSWLFSHPMLGWSQAFSIPCPLLPLPLDFFRLRHRNKFVNQIVMKYRILTFSCNVFLMNPFRYCLYSLSCGFMGFSDTTESGLCFRCLGFFCFWNNGFPYACLKRRSFTWHCSCLWCLQLSPSILHDVFVFFVARINRINSSQFSGVFEFRFLDCPFLFFSERLFQFLSKRQAICDLDVMSFGFLSVTLQTTYILSEEFRSIMWISWNLSTNLTDFYLRRHSNSHQFVFLALHPNRCELTWWHPCNSVEKGMTLLLGRNNGTLGSRRWRYMKSPWTDQKSSRSSASSSYSSGRNSSLSPWDSPLRFSLLTVDSRLTRGWWNS